jgi:hypothetical protein
MDILALIGLVFTLLFGCGTVVWAVSKIRGDTNLLRQAITHLTQEVGRLRSALDHQDARTDDLDRRVLILETKAGQAG